MDDFICPKCGQRHLHIHSILVNSKSGQFEDMHYEWECGWCGHSFGDYPSTAKAKEEYNKEYGGSNNV